MTTGEASDVFYEHIKALHVATQERLAALGEGTGVEYSSSVLLPTIILLVCLLPCMIVACFTTCCKQMLLEWCRLLHFCLCRCCGVWDACQNRRRKNARVASSITKEESDSD